MTKEFDEGLGHKLSFSDDDIIFKPERRHDFVHLFDATRCNPNGDPDNDNLPRQDLEDQHGFTTDVCLKRKLRRFVGDLYGTARETKDGSMNLYAKHRGLLVKEKKIMRGILDKDPEVQTYLASKKTAAEKEKAIEDLDVEIKQGFFRKTYWDVRMFGAVLTTGKSVQDVEPEPESTGSDDAGNGNQPETVTSDQATIVASSGRTAKGRPEETQRKDLLKAGQCVGPLQINYAVTIEPITTDLVSIASSALPSNKPKKDDTSTPGDSGDAENEEARSGTFGNKPITPYGLYRGEGQYAPKLDKKRGLDGKINEKGFVASEDLAVVWNGLRQMFNDDTSASRPAGSMKALAAWVFTHDHKLGNYPLHKLHELIKVVRNEEVKPSDQPAREYADYSVELAWEKGDKRWQVIDRRLLKDGKDIGVSVTELYNDWRD